MRRMSGAQVMSIHTDRFNALPKETRIITGMVITETQINELRISKQRLKRSYDNTIHEINVKIKFLERELKDGES